MTTPIPGSCLCKAVRFEVTPPLSAFRYCHCSRCQKASGAAHAANLFGTPAQIRWLAGEDHIRRYDLPEATRFAVCFCDTCGTRVPHLTRDGKTLVVPAGVLDGDPGLRPTQSIWWESRACWYAEPDAMPKAPGAPA